MSDKKHFVSLSEEERQQVERAARSNKNSVRERVRARILLAANEEPARSDEQIAEQVDASAQTVWRVRRRFATGGLSAALHHAEQARRKARVLDGRAEAHLVALACSAPPAGQARWSLHLLGRKLIETQVVDHVSHETVRQTLLKKSAQALAQEGLVHPAKSQRRVRRRDGRRAGSLPAPL